MVFKHKTYALTESPLAAKTGEDVTYSNVEKQSVKSTNSSNKIKPGETHRPFMGFLYTFLTSLSFAIATVVVKKISYIGVAQLILIRSIGVFIGSLPLVVYCVDEVTCGIKDQLSYLSRGFCGAISMYLNFFACRYLPLAEAAVILSAVPAITTIIARVYLKEPCGVTQSISLVINISGVLISVRLPELLSDRDTIHIDYLYLGGLAAALGCALMFSFMIVAYREIKDVHFSISMMYFGFLGMLTSATISVSTSEFVSPDCGWDLLMYLTIPLLGFLTNCTFTLSTQVEAAGIVSVLFSSLDIVCAIVFQVICFDEALDTYNVIGACLVLASVGLLGIRNWLLILPEKSKSRSRLKYFLL